MFGLLQPAFLALGVLALPLVALYLLKARRTRREVTAVWLWEAVQKDLEARVPLRKLRRDWLLWLQLLVLILLVLAASTPYRRALLTGGDVAVVVDGSASMSAGDRPEQVEKVLRQLVNGLGSGDRMALVLAATRPEVLAPLTEARRELRAAAEQVRSAAISTDLTAAVELAASLVGDAGSVVVVTDPAAAVPTLDERLQVVRLEAERVDNVGIVSLGVRPSDSSGRDHQIFVRLRNASAQPVGGTLKLQVGETVRDAAQLEMGPFEEAGHTLRLLEDASPSAAGATGTVVEVIWQGGGDALAVDDRAYWVVQAPPDRRYRVRGTADPYLRRALAAIGRSRDGWRAAGAEEGAELEILVARTPALEGPPFLWIDPREGRGESVRGAAVLRWERTHPALRFVDLGALRLGRIYRHTRPAGARVLATSTAGPLIFEGAWEGRRYLAWAFDPLETDLPLRVAYPLMIRHALEHLVPAEGLASGGRPTGVPAPFPWTLSPALDDGSADAELVLTSPTGRRVELSPSDGMLRLPPLEEVGVWRLTGNGREFQFATSLLNAAESDLAPRRAEAGTNTAGTNTAGTNTAGTNTAGTNTAAGSSADAVPAASRHSENSLRDLWRPLVVLALILLVFEAFAFHRRWTL